MWTIWKNKNALTFEGKMFWAMDTIQKISEDTKFWCLAQVTLKPNIFKQRMGF